MSQSGVIVRTPSSTITVSVGELATKISAIVGAVTTVVTSTTQASCLVQNVYNLLSNWEYNQQAYSVFPALAAPTRIKNNPIENKIDLVRHGILVETYAPQYPGKPIYVYIGGVSLSWVNVDRLGVFQGGKAGYASTSIVGEQISYAINSDYPIIVAPVQYKLVSSTFVNPPNTIPCAQDFWNQVGGVLQSSSLAWASFVPSYVQRIRNVLSEYSLLYKQEPGRNRWYLVDRLVNVLRVISDTPPLFYAGLITIPQIMQIAGISLITINYQTILQFTPSQALISFENPFPTLNGAPAYTANLCSNDCGLQLAGFVVTPGGVPMPERLLSMVEAQLIAPPKDFTYESLRDYASRLGQVRWFDQLMERIFKAFDVVTVLVTTYAVPQSVAEKAVEAIDWFGEEFAKSVGEIAQDIYNELNRPEHHADTHTDQAGQEVHNAYMCVRFGINCRE